MKRNILTSSLQTLATGAFSLTLLGVGSAYAALTGELGILDLTANNGLNPATGVPWVAGDQYRFAFVSSGTSAATSSDIATYNSFVQSSANASSLGLNATNWNAIVSTATVNARDNTSTNPNTDGVGESIWRMDGKAIISNNYADFWSGSHLNQIDRDENKNLIPTTLPVSYGGWSPVWTGTNADGTVNGSGLGPGGGANVRFGLARGGTTQHWVSRSSAPEIDERFVYALSDPLSVQGPAPLYWDINGGAGGAGGATPGGTWDTGTNWNTDSTGGAGGTVSGWTAGETAFFSGGTDATGSYTVTVNGTPDIGGGLIFQNGNATISGGGLRMIADTPFGVGSGASATISSTISEDGTSRSMTKSGDGTLVLSGNNSYSGNTTILAGTLSVPSLANIGSNSPIGAGDLILSGGTLKYTGGPLSLSRPLNLSESSTIDVSTGGTSLNLGDLSLSSKRLTVNGGTGSSLSVGAVTATNHYAGLDTNIDTTVASVTNIGRVFVLQGTATNSIVTGTLNLGGQRLDKNESGKWILAGNNTYTQTRLYGGTLQIGNGGSTGTLGTDYVDMRNNGILSFNRTGTYTVNNRIYDGSGLGHLVQNGSGTIILTNKDNAYTGSTTINNGILEIAGDGQINSTSSIIINGGEFRYNSNTPLTKAISTGSGRVSGTGALTSLTVGAGGVHAPGNSPGLQVVTTEGWNDGGTYQWEIQNTTGSVVSDWDYIDAGTLDLSGLTGGTPFNIDITAFAGGSLVAPANSETWDILEYDSLIGTFDSNDFSLNPIGFDSTWDDVTWSLEDVGGVLELTALNTAIPEPSTLFLVSLGLLSGTFRRRGK